MKSAKIEIRLSISGFSQNIRRGTYQIVELHTKFIKDKELLTISFDKALIETEIKICTSLKSGFYFRFYC